MHEPDELKYGQKGQRVPPVSDSTPWSEGTATSGAQGGIAKISELGRSKAQ